MRLTLIPLCLSGTPLLNRGQAAVFRTHAVNSTRRAGRTARGNAGVTQFREGGSARDGLDSTLGTTEPAASPVVRLLPHPPFCRGNDSEKHGNSPGTDRHFTMGIGEVIWSNVTRADGRGDRAMEGGRGICVSRVILPIFYLSTLLSLTTPDATCVVRRAPKHHSASALFC